MWDFPGSGIEPLFPGLAGGFLLSGPPGSPQVVVVFFLLKSALLRDNLHTRENELTLSVQVDEC